MEASIAVEERRRVFHILDLLRGIAALAVVARHLDGRINGWLPGSHLAVDLFFVLSGLVVSHAYEQRLTSRRLAPANFMKIRLVRLYPLYILGTLLVFAMILAAKVIGHGEPISPGTLLAPLVFAMLFLPTPGQLSFDNFHVYPLNFPAWSLFWELVVNLGYAVFARRLNPWILGGILTIGAAALVRSSLVHHGLDTGSDFATFGAGLPRVIFSFTAGVAIEHGRRSGRLPSFSLPALASVLILLAAFALRSERASDFYDPIVVIAVFPLLVAFSLGDPPAWAIGICARLGLASYAIYALQAPFLKVTANLGHGLSFEVGLLIAFAFIALVADRHYDRPVRALLTRLLSLAGQRGR